MQYKRIDWIDSLKGILILFVVIGHALGCASHMAQSLKGSNIEHLCDAIYVFHMPGFFFVAGMVWKSQDNFMSFAAKKFMRLMVPYFVFGVLSSIVYLMALGEFKATISEVTNDAYYKPDLLDSIWDVVYALIHAGGAPNGFMFRMNSVLWFLPCLFAVELAYFWIDRLVRTIPYRLVCGIALWAIASFTARFSDWILPYGLMRLPSCLGFMILGSCLANQLKQKAINLRFVAKGICSILFFVAFYVVFPNPWVARVNVLWFFAFKVAAIAGIGMCVFISRIVDCKIFRIIGLASMTIMLLHKFPLMFLQLKVKLLASMFSMGVMPFGFALACVCIGAIMLCLLAHQLISRFAPWAIGQRRTI